MIGEFDGPNGGIHCDRHLCFVIVSFTAWPFDDGCVARVAPSTIFIGRGFQVQQIAGKIPRFAIVPVESSMFIMTTKARWNPRRRAQRFSRSGSVRNTFVH